MGDFYTEDPGRLNGQPKRTIGDYVESNGILVPNRYDTLQEGRRSHRPILLRSEHTQEYDGVSGLLDSLSLFGDHPFKIRGLETVDDVKRHYFDKIDSEDGTANHRMYAQIMGIGEEIFMDEISFSVWENIGGINRTVIADSSIPGRYHIMTHYDEKNRTVTYTIVEDGKIVKHYDYFKGGIGRIKSDIPGIIETYENVRSLGNFDPNNCPIMEMQTHNGKNYFLQYHRGRDFEECDFVLDRDPSNGEKKVHFARGHTGKDGMDVKTTLEYGKIGIIMDPGIEEGSFDFHYNFIFTDLMSRNRKLQISEESMPDLVWTLTGFVHKHDQISKLFKPQVSVIDKPGRYFTPKEHDDAIKKADETGENQYLDLHVVADGKNAFIQRI